MIHVRQRSGTTLSHRATEWLILHLVACNVTGWIVHRASRWRNEQSVHAADRAVWRLALIKEE